MKKYGMILAAFTAAMLAVTGCGNASSAPTQAAAPATEAKTEAAKEESKKVDNASEAEKTEAAEGFEFKEPVNVIVPFKAGGTSDQQIRILQPYLEKELGTTLVIINSDGGSGVLGTTEYINNYKPDGYSILYTLATPVVYKPLTGDTSYTWGDLQAVSKTMSLPMYLILSNESPFQSGEEIIEYIKANPGKFSYANVGNGGNGHLAFASFLAGEGLDAKSVPYSGGTAECYTSIIGKECDAAVYGQADLLAHNDTHAAINLGSKSEVESLKDVPTLADLGYEGYETNNLGGFIYQKNVPAEAVKAFDAAVERVLSDPAFIEEAGKAGFTASYSSAADFQKEIENTIQTAEPVMKALGY